MRGLARYVTLLTGLGLLFAAGAVLHPQFMTIANQRDVLAQVSINGILAVGMTLVILTGGIDLSVGSILSLGTVVCAMLLMGSLTGGHVSTAGVCLIVPLVGAAMGALNGAIVARTRLQPFIVTLAMMVAAVGLAKLVAGHGGQIHAIYAGDADHAGAPASFERLGATIVTVGQETLRGGKVHELKLIPVPGLFLLGAWLVVAFVLHKLPVGRYIFAVGGNEEAARLAGVPVGWIKVFVYAACGLLAGLAAVLYCAQYTQGKADAGSGKELDAIAAVVIGGTSLAGGRGSILGTLVGVLIFGYLTNILQLNAVSSEIQDILKGIIIVGAAVVQSGDALGGLRRLVSRPPG